MSMTPAEFRRLGYLQEVNRRFLHPLGLALSVQINDDGTESLGEIWDYRDDPEGIRFVDGVLEQNAVRVADEWARRETIRVAALGYMIQPAEMREDPAMTTVPHDPDDPAEVAAVQTPEGEPDAELIDPASLPPATPVGQPGPDDESSEKVLPG